MRLAGRYSGAYVVDLSGDRPRAVFRWRQHTAAHPGLEHEAVHHHRGAGPLRHGGHARHRGARRRASSTPRASAAATSTCAAAATRPSAAARFTRALLRRRRDRPGPRRRARGRRHRARHRPGATATSRAFDSLRGGPDSGYGVSIWVGPLSALSYNRGLFTESGRGFQANPPAFAAARLDDALEARGIAVRLQAARRAHAGAARDVLASVDSPPMARLIRLTNKPSDNFFAETLAEGPRARRPAGAAPRRGGARLAAALRPPARRRGATARRRLGPLARQPRLAVQHRPAAHARCTRATSYDAFVGLAADRGPRRHARSTACAAGPARDRCRGKTGTLSNVSALSGYCEARSGDNYAFSILMNGVYRRPARARLQDRMRPGDRRRCG